MMYIYVSVKFKLTLIRKYFLNQLAKLASRRHFSNSAEAIVCLIPLINIIAISNSLILGKLINEQINTKNLNF